MGPNAVFHTCVEVFVDGAFAGEPINDRDLIPLLGRAVSTALLVVPVWIGGGQGVGGTLTEVESIQKYCSDTTIHPCTQDIGFFDPRVTSDERRCTQFAERRREVLGRNVAWRNEFWGLV